MFYLDFHNTIIESILLRYFYGFHSSEPLNITFSDFSGVSYHISTPVDGQSEQLRLSLHWNCWAQLIQYGAMDVLNREYGPWIIQPPEEEYDFTLQFNIHDLVGNKDPEKVIRNVALLRRNALSGPFERAFAAQAHALTEDNPDFDQSAIEFMRIDCHPDERMYIRHQKQFTQVILGMNLDGFDELSKVFVKLLFEELVHRSRLRSYCTRAPRVIYANLAPPSEVDGREEVIHDHSRCRAYITFLIFPSLIATKKDRENIISQRMIFRDYMLYHIKAYKRSLNKRMTRNFNEHVKHLTRTSKKLVPPLQQKPENK